MKQREKAYQKNNENILDMFDDNIKARFLDLGCDDGVWTMKMARKIGTKDVHGVELIQEAASKAEKKGIRVTIGDLNNKFPYKDCTFDIVHSNQVIEHLKDTDSFLDEIYRILKPQGYAVISTENLSSWHNIVALVLGYMPFSLTNISLKKAAVGNPFAPHSGKPATKESSWQHQRIFTLYGLKQLGELSGFTTEKVLVSGYYPLGNFFSNIDPRHAHFFVMKFKK
jgi:SAM-dependent methyltransferase